MDVPQVVDISVVHESVVVDIAVELQRLVVQQVVDFLLLVSTDAKALSNLCDITGPTLQPRTSFKFKFMQR